MLHALTKLSSCLYVSECLGISSQGLCHIMLRVCILNCTQNCCTQQCSENGFQIITLNIIIFYGIGVLFCLFAPSSVIVCFLVLRKHRNPHCTCFLVHVISKCFEIFIYFHAELIVFFDSSFLTEGMRKCGIFML